MTIKFPNRCYYCNTTNAIYWGRMRLVRENIYLYDVQVSTCLVYAYEDYNCFGEVMGFKMEQSSNLGFEQN
jgi:hypothetical protein